MPIPVAEWSMRSAACTDSPISFWPDAGVFTTAGAANPTLTIVALALRLGDYLRARAV
ncbi:hypothetical protein [Gemmatimonas sp.]|uniref:hypothetical protein n=1 Tax=Gemmatimonas sp. TaxID=1962908 RepID=UPI003DA477EE